MFLLGILALFQITFIPGILILKIFNIKSHNFIQTFLYSFGFSLTFNYYLICALVFFKIYLPIIIFILFFLEILVLSFFAVNGKLKVPFNKTLKEYYFEFTEYLKNIPSIHRILFLFAIILLIFFSSLIYADINTVYYFTDAIARRPWMINWSSNEFLYYGHYLQLLPTNLSLINIFIQETVPDFFSKMIMPLFFVGILLIFLDLSYKRDALIYLTGFILYSFILLIFYGVLLISDFNLDISTAFFGFLSFYTIMKQDESAINLQTILLVAIFAVSAANIKLVGLFVVGLSILWITYFMFNNRKNFTKEFLYKSAIFLTLIYLVGLFWYIIVPTKISEGIGSSPYKPYNGLYESFLYGSRMLYYSFGPVFSLLILGSLLFSLFTKARSLVLFMIAPLFFVWAFWYSYDCRNLSVALPFTALSAAFGLEFIYKKLLNKFNHIKSVRGDSKPALLTQLFKHKILSSFSFILLLILIFFIINSNGFFNFGISLSYFFRIYYFLDNITIYTIELGYYKYVLYFIEAADVLIILTIILFLLKKSEIKIIHIIIFIMIGLTTLNFTLLSRERLLQSQKNDEEMVDAHNIYFLLRPYIYKSQASIITNSSYFRNLIFPKGVEVKYYPELNLERINDFIQDKNERYILLEKKYNMKEINGESYYFLTNSYTTYVTNEKFIFLGLPLIKSLYPHNKIN